jgi:hypothetical protein
MEPKYSFLTSYERWMNLAPPFLKVEKVEKVDEFGSTFFKGGKIIYIYINELVF